MEKIEIMKTREDYPKESSTKNSNAEDGNDTHNENPNQEVNEEETTSTYEDEDSSHYSVGGDNGW